MPGLQLARRFFHDLVAPSLRRLVPDLAIGAALIGDGSEVLGYDDAISADHDWGPRVQIFVRSDNFEAAAVAVTPALDGLLPDRFIDWRVGFRDPDRTIGVDPQAGVAVDRARELTPLDWTG